MDGMQKAKWMIILITFLAVAGGTRAEAGAVSGNTQICPQPTVSAKGQLADRVSEKPCFQVPRKGTYMKPAKRMGRLGDKLTRKQ